MADDQNSSSFGSFAPIVRLNNSTSTNKRPKNNATMLVPAYTLSLPPSTPPTAVVMQQSPQQQMLLPVHSSTASMNDTIAGLGYRSWSSLFQLTAANAVTATEPANSRQDPVAHHQERIDNPPPPGEHNTLSSLQRAFLFNDTPPDDMEADDHINLATRKADVSDGHFNRKMKTKKNKGGERAED
jgi:hypothetical protein